MPKKETVQVDKTTEEKIKDAARKVFMKKGYSATRTRDIAEEAGINLALLNYYFRSKEKLFEIVMMEKMQKLFGILVPVLTNETIDLDEKVKLIVSNYIDMLLDNQDLPIFVLSEIKNNPEKFAANFQLATVISNSSFIKQLKERAPGIHPIQFFMNIMGMTVFPFIGKPLLQAIGSLDPKAFNELMQQRKQLIPTWVNAMLETS